MFYINDNMMNEWYSCSALHYSLYILRVNFSSSLSQSKRIAGRIIPAIATTTAAVAGLMCVELYKLVMGHQDLSSYRTAYINLAVEYFVLSQPSRPPGFEVSNSSVRPQPLFVMLYGLRGFRDLWSSQSPAGPEYRAVYTAWQTPTVYAFII